MFMAFFWIMAFVWLMFVIVVFEPCCFFLSNPSFVVCIRCVCSFSKIQFPPPPPTSLFTDGSVFACLCFMLLLVLFLDWLHVFLPVSFVEFLSRFLVFLSIMKPFGGEQEAKR